MDSEKIISIFLTLILTGCSCQSYGYGKNTGITSSHRPFSPYASAVSGSYSKSGSENGANAHSAITGSGSYSVVLGGYGLSGAFVDRNSDGEGSMNTIVEGGSRMGRVVNEDTMTGSGIGIDGTGGGMPSPFSTRNAGSVSGGFGMGTGGSGSGMPSQFSSGNSGSTMGGSGIENGGSGAGMPSPFSSGNSGGAMGGSGMGTGGSGAGMPSQFSSGNSGGVMGGSGMGTGGSGAGMSSQFSSGSSGGAMSGSGMGTGGSGAGMPSPFSSGNSGGAMGESGMGTGGSGAGMPSPFSSGNSGGVMGGSGMGTGGSGAGMSSQFSSGSSGGAMSGSGMGTGGSGAGMPSPFSSGNSGGAMGGSGYGTGGSGAGMPSPFSSGNSGGVMGGSNMGKGGSGAGMPSPFSTGNTGSTGNGQGPFTIASSGSGGILDGSGKGMSSLLSTSTASGGGPGSMGGGSFATDMMGSAGPGGFAGGSFDIGLESSGPGGLAGGAFGIGGGSGLSGDGDNSLYDTTNYQTMLQEQFHSDMYEPGLTGNPFSGESATSAKQDNFVDYDKHPYYSLGSYAVSSGSGWDGSSTQAGVVNAGKGTGANPFDTNSYSADSKGPFTASNSKTGSRFSDGSSSSGGSSFSGGSSYSTGMSGEALYTDTMLTGEAGVGAGPFSSSFANSVQSAGNSGSYGSSYSSGVGYGTAATSDEQRYLSPFTGSYNDLVTNPLSPHSNDQSNFGNLQGGSISYGSSQGNPNSSPFNVKQGFSSSTSSMGFGGSRSPGGNPANQQGSNLGFNLSRQDPSHQGGASYNMPYSQLRGRRTSNVLNSLWMRRSTNPLNTSPQNRRPYF